MGEYEGGYTSINLSLRACHQPPGPFTNRTGSQTWILRLKGRERGLAWVGRPVIFTFEAYLMNSCWTDRLGWIVGRTAFLNWFTKARTSEKRRNCPIDSRQPERKRKNGAGRDGTARFSLYSKQFTRDRQALQRRSWTAWILSLQQAIQRNVHNFREKAGKSIRRKVFPKVVPHLSGKKCSY